MWNERFSEPGYAYGTEANEFLVSMADRIPPGRVLCLAEGEGRNAVFLAQRGFNVTAVDTSDVGLAKANDLASKRGVTINTVLADLAGYDIGANQWQGIVSIFCHQPPSARADLHRRVVEGLAPGGVLVLEGFEKRQLGYGTGGPKNPDLMFELETIRNDLAGLDLEIARDLDRDLNEGRYHRGTAAVVQIMGTKK